jgi:uncharacterized delta-60 repeat protein
MARYHPDGSPDTTFGESGVVTTTFNSYDGGANAIAIHPDGKILLAGFTIDNQTHQDSMALARFNPDGSLDTAFGSEGKVVVDVGDYDSFATSIAIQSDGKIVVGGTIGDFVLVRFNADGSLDTTFDSDGIVTTEFGGDDNCYDIALQADNKIVAGGNSDVRQRRFRNRALQPDGSLDNGSDNDGMLLTGFSGSDYASAVVIPPQG